MQSVYAAMRLPTAGFGAILGPNAAISRSPLAARDETQTPVAFFVVQIHSSNVVAARGGSCGLRRIFREPNQ